MSLSLTPMPADAGAFTHLPNTDPASGIVTFTARPTRHAWASSQTVLAALGAKDDVFGAGRRHDQDLTLLHAWLHAYDVKVIVVRHAVNLLHRGEIRTLMDNLLHIAAAVGAHLALTCDDTVTTWINDWVDQHGGTIHNSHEPLLNLIEEAKRSAATPVSENDVDFPQYLPRIDFYGFRARCRDILTPAQFDQVNRLYITTFQAVHADPYATQEEAFTRLAGTAANHVTPGEVLTIARAAQAAMFTHGLLLKIDMASLLRGVHDAEHRRLTPSEVRALRAYRTPWRSSAVVLRDADLTPAQILGLTLSNVTEDGGITGLPHLPLHDDARTYLRAQRRYRLDLGAAPEDPFITEVARHVNQALRRCGAELNLPSAFNHEKASETRTDRWRKAMGVSLLPLVTQHLPTPDQIKKAA